MYLPATALFSFRSGRRSHYLLSWSRGRAGAVHRPCERQIKLTVADWPPAGDLSRSSEFLVRSPTRRGEKGWRVLGVAARWQTTCDDLTVRRAVYLCSLAWAFLASIAV